MSWRRCSSCKNEIGFSEIYWQCSVSTCNRARTGLFFCSVACWEAHLPLVRHREAFAVEAKSPTRDEAALEDDDRPETAPAAAASGRQVVSSDPRKRVAVPPPPAADSPGEPDVLIVVTKLKKYIKDRRGLNTSDGVMPLLSEYLRRLCDAAAQNAVEDGRKTVLDRDFTSLIR